MTTEAKVAQPTGQSVRAREAFVQQPDGTYALVEQQVVTLARSDGTLYDDVDTAERLLHDSLALDDRMMRAGTHVFEARAFARDTVGAR